MVLLGAGIAGARLIGLPSFGGAQVVTITLTAQTKHISDTFLLTALPQITQASLATRTLPDRRLTVSVNGSKSIPTSGTRTIPGTQASGTLLFSNGSTFPVTVPAGSIFSARSGVQVRLSQSVIVPRRVNGVNGTASGPGVAVQVGQSGNLAPGALNVTCCGGSLSVSNPAAFSGGSDARAEHFVAQSDVDGVKNALLTELETQATQRLDGQLQPDESRAGQPVFTVLLSASPPVGSVSTQVSVSVSISADALAYNARLVSQLASQLLGAEAAQTVGATYRQRGNLTIAPPAVEQQGQAGQLYLSIAVSGLWSYNITSSMQEQWRQAIKGASTTLAQSYLSTRPGVSAVHIALPFGVSSIPADGRAIVFVIV